MRKRNDYNEVTNAVRVLATEYQYSAAQNQWYLHVNNASKAVKTEDVKDVIRHLAVEAYAIDAPSKTCKTWMDRVYSEACISPETTVLMWMQEALELNVCGRVRGCDLHAVWAVDHGIYDYPFLAGYYKTPAAAYAAIYKAQARRFYDVLEREGKKYGILKLNKAMRPPGVKFTGCTLRPPHKVPVEDE